MLPIHDVNRIVSHTLYNVSKYVGSLSDYAYEDMRHVSGAAEGVDNGGDSSLNTW